jgi:salicylate hydroxylase
VIYDSKLTCIKDESGDPNVTAIFANGKEVKADFVLGCDGVHSAVRTQYVEPSRQSIYTDVAVAYSIVDGNGIDVHFNQTSMNAGRFGSLLASYVDPDRTKIYLGAVMECPQQEDKQGWRVRGNDRQKTLDEIDRRYKGSAIPCVDELIKRAHNFIFYPVYNLGPGGNWSRGRVLLLGDAAHGVGSSSSCECDPLMSS